MNKLTNPFFCVIQIPLYKQNVMISVNQTNDQLLSSIVRTSSVWPKGVKRTKDKIEHLLEAFADTTSTTDGRTVLYDSGIIIMRMYKIESIYYPENLGTFAHELFHIVSFIAKKKGLVLNESSEEAFSYLTGHIASEFFRIYQKKNQL